MYPPFDQVRPRSVTITIWGVFLFGMWNVGRAVALHLQADILLAFGSRLDPRVRLVAAIMWAVLFGADAILLRRKYHAARWLTPLLLSGYGSYELGLVWLLAPDLMTETILLPDVLIYMGVILFSGWALNRRGSRPYFTINFNKGV